LALHELPTFRFTHAWRRLRTSQIDYPGGVRAHVEGRPRAGPCSRRGRRESCRQTNKTRLQIIERPNSRVSGAPNGEHRRRSWRTRLRFTSN